MVLDKLENEIKGFSKWFKPVFFVLFVVYLSAWLFTVYLSNVQKEKKFDVILPVVPQDSEEYRNLAESMLQGKGFSQNGEADTLRTPGYPSFVALFKYVGRSYFAVSLVQIILVFCSALIIRRLGIHFHQVQVGEVAATIFLLNPLTLTLSLIILTDILFLFLFMLGFYIAISSKKIILASVLFATAIYVRPMGIFAFPIFAVPFIASKISIKEKTKSLFIMAITILLLVSPWVYRNYKLTGVAGFTSFKAINLAAYAAPLFLANKNHTPADLEREKIEKSVGIPQGKWRDLRYSKTVALAAEKIILNDPFSYAKYHITASFPFLFPSSVQDTINTYKGAMNLESEYVPGAINYLTAHEWKLFFKSVTKIWWKVAERILWAIIYLVALIGFWQNRKNLLSYAFVFIFAYLMLLAGPAAGGRYAFQTWPFILLLFSAGAIYLKGRITKKNV